MRRNEAAQYLGISTKTLYRMEQSGRLASRKIKTSKGQIVEYDQADLDRLKVELLARTKTPRVDKPSGLRRVTFGLSPHDYQELSDDAKKYDMKPGEYARKLMREALESNLRSDIEDLYEQSKSTNEEVKILRHKLAGAVEMVLEILKFSPEEASNWVTENLR